LKLGQVL